MPDLMQEYRRSGNWSHGLIDRTGFVMIVVNCKTYMASALNSANTLRDE